MGVFTIRLPDVGEGIAEAELTEWHVKPGDLVREDDVLAAVMTDKAALEVPSEVDGTVLELGGEIGDMIPVGAVLIRLEIAGESNEDVAPEAPAAKAEEDTAPEPEPKKPPSPALEAKPAASAPAKRDPGQK
ncbi:MAG: 2-oxo acid dehydrogenase subunit E2, partial [Rhizobiales bacterium]|nr:2-oxo acid dehydrogenase subunit E2 [Hyphomicrobiales bacterium]